MPDPTTTDTRAASPDFLDAPRWLADAVQRLEELDRLDAAANTMGRAAPLVERGQWGAFLRGEWLGHALHPLLTDFPLGCWMSANILDLVGGRSARPAARRLIGIGVLAVPLTAASGLADWAASDDARIGRVGTVHAAGNVLVGGAYLASWRARRAGRHARGVAWALAGGALAVATGYLGGHMSFARGASVEPRGLERVRTGGAAREAGDAPAAATRTTAANGDRPPAAVEGQAASG